MKKNYLIIDILRICCILEIVCYHSWETLYGSETIPFSASESLYGWVNQFLCGNFGYAGLGIVFISLFIAGFTGHESRVPRWILLIGGALALNASDDTSMPLTERFSWNIYCYLLIAYFVVYIYSKFKKSHYLVAVSSFLLLLTDHHFWTSNIHLTDPDLVYVIFGGPDGDFIGWGMLPWIALPLFSWALGRIAQDFLPELKKLWRWEIPTYALIMVVLLWNWPLQENILISRSGFYSYIFKSPSIYFWSRFIPFLILFRFAFLDSIDIWIQQHKPWDRMAQFIDGLCWNRHFGFAYFFQFIIIQIGIPWREYLFEHPRILDLYWILILVLTEIWMRMFVGGFGFLKKHMPVPRSKRRK